MTNEIFEMTAKNAKELHQMLTKYIKKKYEMSKNEWIKERCTLIEILLNIDLAGIHEIMKDNRIEVR